MTTFLIPVTILSAAGYQCFNSALNFNFLPPPPGKYAGRERHRWRNAVTSLLQSTVMVSTVLYCFFSDPVLWYEPELHYAVAGEICFAILIGYLIYDTYDLMVHSHYSKVWSLVVHHVILIIVISTLCVEQLLMGAILTTFLFEFSAIFLHSRQLLLMYGFSKHSKVFNVHRIFNLVTFVLLRMVPVTYGLYVAFTCQHLTMFLAVMTRSVMTTIEVLNLGLLWRVLCNDFLSKDGKDNHIMDN